MKSRSAGLAFVLLLVASSGAAQDGGASLPQASSLPPEGARDAFQDRVRHLKQIDETREPDESAYPPLEARELDLEVEAWLKQRSQREAQLGVSSFKMVGGTDPHEGPADAPPSSRRPLSNPALLLPGSRAHLGGGPGASIGPSRRELLRAAVQLRSRDTDLGVCSGTIVERAGQRYVLTAHHCFYEIGIRSWRPRPMLVGVIYDNKVEVARFPVEQTRDVVKSGLGACVALWGTNAAERCVDVLGHPDVVLVKANIPHSAGVVPWSVCDAAPKDSTWTLYGYGPPTEGSADTTLYQGNFSYRELFLLDPRPTPLQPDRSNLALTHGDSGGPAFSNNDDHGMDAGRAPSVCFVISRLQLRLAIAQPTWAMLGGGGGLRALQPR